MRAKSLSAARTLAIEPISYKTTRKHLLSVVAPQMPRISVVERFVPAPTVLPSYVPRTIMALE
ncbi:MAG: hypothetical protein WA660_10105, partial [Candidatus Acidiferrales bacterium]